MALLQAGRGVQPSAESLIRARALGALGVTAAAATIGTTTPVVAATATKGGLTLASKLLIVSLVGSGAVAGGIAVRAASHAARQPAAPLTPAAVSAPPRSLDLPRAAPVPAETPAEAVSVPAPPVRSGARAPRPDSSSDQLAREVKTLELAHRALAEHDPRTALALLDRYRAQFPGGSLSSDAVVLRVQALLATGDRAGAQAQADAYAAAHPGTPFAVRLQEIARGQ
jgi:hypothetical protein